MRTIGAIYNSNGCRFTVWAPEKDKMMLHIIGPDELKAEMSKDAQGYFSADIPNVLPGSRYYYIPDDEKDYPDPASFYQPQGVHGPSEVMNHTAFQWHDQNWRGIPLRDLILYEIHVGTFTQEGTFEAIIPLLSDIANSGINAIEIMPVSQFPGDRNWGYDGAYPYAVQNSYGGPEGLKRLVDACHVAGIAVYLDVVYNHLGPDGSYLPAFAPYFTQKYNTPWGKAINFDDEWSDGVRNYFCNNAIYWIENFHLDGLRLDAIHQMYDFGAVHFWELLHDAVKEKERELGRQFYLIAESDLNNPKVIKDPEAGGYGFDAQWLDDFHHSVYTLLYKKGTEQYADFGSIKHLIKAYKDGFVHSGGYVQFRKRSYGASTAGLPGDRFIIFNQNHDQVGNSADGGRLSSKISFEKQKVAAAILLLAPYIPMLFMGEEYGEDAPFAYFTSHTDKELVEAIKKGRKEEFKAHNWATEPLDPQDVATFTNCKIKWEKRRHGKHKVLLEWNKRLINLRKMQSALQSFKKDDIDVWAIAPLCFIMHRQSHDGLEHLIAIYNISSDEVSCTMPSYTDSWKMILNSSHFDIDLKENINRPTDVAPAQQVHIPPDTVLIFAGTQQ